MDFGVLGNVLLSNPLVQGMLLGQAKAFVQSLFKKVDDQGLAKQHEAWLQPLLVVLTLVTSAISMALQGHLSTVDLSSVEPYLLAVVNTYLGAKATEAAGSKTTKALADKLVKSVAKK